MERKIYMGCGPDIKEGFIHADIRDMPHVDIVCSAWELSQNIDNIDLIYSRHMLEHLTNIEVQITLQDWFKALRDKGTIQIIVPNIDFHFQQWLDAKWDINKEYGNLSDEVFNLSGIYGWQKECNPLENNVIYWDVHKSGYNKKRMKYILHNIGFENIKIDIINNIHLQATATKTNQKSTVLLADNYKENISLEDKRDYQNIINIYNNIENIDKNKKYILYGFGTIGKLIFPHIKDNLIAIIDNALTISSIDNIDIIKIKDLDNIKDKNIIISPFIHQSSIKDSLKKYNCNFIYLNN